MFRTANLDSLKKGDILNVSLKGLDNTWIAINLGRDSFKNWKVIKVLKNSGITTGFYVKNGKTEIFMQVYHDKTNEEMVCNQDFLLIVKEAKSPREKFLKKMKAEGWVSGFAGMEKVINGSVTLIIGLDDNCIIKQIFVSKVNESKSLQLSNPIKTYKELENFISIYTDIYLNKAI
jgi:hypothetical protein